MTDVQCPAVVVLLGAGAADPAWLGRLRVADRIDASGRPDVGAVIEEVADRFRGETVVLRAPDADVVRALRSHGIGIGPPVVVEVDSGGWTVRQP